MARPFVGKRKERKIGMKKEQEHVHVIGEAKVPAVVSDHLKEDPHYYTKLKKAGL